MPPGNRDRGRCAQSYGCGRSASGHAEAGIEKEREMIKRWVTPALGLALALSVGMAQPAMALRLKGMKPAAKSTAAAMGMKTVTGMIKGAPAGKTYTVVSGRSTAIVDTSHARIRSKG